MIYKMLENRVSRTYSGGKKIDEFYSKDVCENSFCPEDWTASAVKTYNSDSEGIGMTEEGITIPEIIGNDDIKILVKLLNSAERLVIQTHPTVELAKEFLNSPCGKTECWYFLDCEEGAYVYFGFKKGVTRSEWENTFYTQNTEKMLSMLHKIPVKKGDFIFVDGGIPHAIGEGCFMIELQEPSDLMVVNEKFTPSGREIPEMRLHMGMGYEKMSDVYDYSGYSLGEIKERFCPAPKPVQENVFEILGKSLTDKFSMYLIKKKADFSQKRRFAVMIITDGEGDICGKSVKKGDRLFIVDEKNISICGNDEFEAVICM